MFEVPTSQVTAVLIAGVWYEVVAGTFVVDEWEFDTGPGQPETTLAYTFTGQRSETMFGRVSDLQSIRY